MDDDFFAELIQTFISEFEELMGLYQKSLHIIRKSPKLTEEKKQAYADLFRIYHTLKGDSGYLPEYEKFTQFTKEFCEKLRPLDSSVYDDNQLLKEISLNYTRLSSALNALKNGKSLTQFNFPKFTKPKEELLEQ